MKITIHLYYRGVQQRFFLKKNHYILLPAKKTPPNLYKFTKAAAAARSPSIKAFGLEENTCNGVSMPCGEFDITF